MKPTKGSQVTARLHESTKLKLAKSGYNAAEAIEWFVNEFYSNNPRRQLEIRQDLEEIELNKLKKIECEIQLEIEHKERVIQDLVIEKSKYPEIKTEPEIIIKEEDPEDVLSDGEIEAIERVRNAWDDRKDMMLGSHDDVVEVFNSFITKEGDFISEVHKTCCKRMPFKEFKALLIKEVVEV